MGFVPDFSHVTKEQVARSRAISPSIPNVHLSAEQIASMWTSIRVVHIDIPLKRFVTIPNLSPEKMRGLIGRSEQNWDAVQPFVAATVQVDL